MEHNNDNYDLTRLKSYNRFKGNVTPLSIDITTGQRRAIKNKPFEEVYDEFLNLNVNLHRGEFNYDLSRLECNRPHFYTKLGNIAPKN